MIFRAALLILIVGTTPAVAACRQALALALDVSGSVDAHEYALQRDGVAAALEDPQVAEALLAMPQAPVALLIYEWSGTGYQRILVPWSLIEDAARLASVIATLRGTRRVEAPSTTALGTAIDIGRTLLAARPDCWRHTLDVSGDGPSNEGPRPRDLPPGPDQADVTVNALVIGPATLGDDGGDGPDKAPNEGAGKSPAPAPAPAPASGGRSPTQDLLSYFRAEVIGGPGAFAEPVEGYAHYRAAMIRKLLREIRTLAIGSPQAPLPIRRLR